MRSAVTASVASWEEPHVLAFNDIALVRTPGHGLASVELSVGGQPFLRYAADAVVVAVGYRADEEQVEALRCAAPEFHWIGDCFRPGKVTTAVSMGYYTALDI